MKRKLIIALLYVNVALLVALAVDAGARQARAQTFPTTDYIMMTSQLAQTLHGVCVVDLASRRMMAWRLRRAGARYTLTPFRSRDLERDFGRKQPVPPP